MSEGPRVVAFPRHQYRDTAVTLRRLADQLDAGELAPCDVGVLVLLGNQGGVEVFGFGPQSQDLQCIATLRLAEHKLIGMMLAPDGE